MEITSDILEAVKGLGKNQKQIIKSLRNSSISLHPLMSIRKVIFNLRDRGIIEIQDEKMSLTFFRSCCPYLS
jgi:hypothetical protein